MNKTLKLNNMKKQLINLLNKFFKIIKNQIINNNKIN